jgi:hypothetical protein
LVAITAGQMLKESDSVGVEERKAATEGEGRF